MKQYSLGIDQGFQANAMASFVRIAAVILLITMCYQIVRPFASIVAWAMIISVAVHPAHLALSTRLGGQEKLSALLLALFGLVIIVAPAWMLAESTLSALQSLAGQVERGSLSIPAPPDNVATWPLIGERLYDFWHLAATNLEEVVNMIAPKLRGLGQTLLGAAGGMVLGVLQFVLSIIIAAVLLPGADGAYRTTQAAAVNLLGPERGGDITRLSIDTIRSVTKGVLGVALIQSILAGIGLAVMDVPGAGLWSFAVLVLAIVQLPPLLVLGPIAVWVFSVSETVPATIFAVYAFVVSIADGFLKPMLLGRGLNVPMLVILIGAIGGALWAGIIGLFVGSVALALGYSILTEWLESGVGATTGESDRG
jgi:predicted PurR-regulated permease PerM